MSNITEYNGIVAFHPGYYIEEYVKNQKISEAEFAKQIGLDEEALRKLICGEIDVTQDIAAKLSVQFGTSAKLWTNLQGAYDERIREIQQEKLKCQKGGIKNDKE